MEQKFSNNSIDLQVLSELCEREGGAVAYRKEIHSLRKHSANYLSL